MLGKIYHMLAWVCIAAVLAEAGLAGFLQLKGRLSPANVAIAGKMLRGEPIAEIAAVVKKAPTTQPAAAAEQQIAMNDEVFQLSNLRIDRREQEMKEYQRTQLELLHQAVAAEREKLRKDRLAWEAEIRSAQQRQESAGFKKQLALYEKLDAKQVKDLFMEMDDAEAADYLRAMKPYAASNVVAQFRTATEKTRLMQLLELAKQRDS